MMITALGPVAFVHVFTCFFFVTGYYCLFIFWFLCLFFSGGPINKKKKGNKNETYSDVSDFLLIFLKLNNFVLLADSLPIFLVVCHALEVVGGA